MEQPNRIAQLYGYSVCLVAVIAILVSISSLVGAVIDLSDPIHAGGGFMRPSLASFEAYKLDTMTFPREGPPRASTSGNLPDDQTLRAAYEAAREDRIQSVRLQSYRSMAVSGLVILLSIVLFTTHWLWVRRLTRAET